MFRRYNITDGRDITDAMVKTQQYIQTLPKERQSEFAEASTSQEAM
jgi:hypothetical protein